MKIDAIPQLLGLHWMDWHFLAGMISNIQTCMDLEIRLISLAVIHTMAMAITIMLSKQI